MPQKLQTPGPQLQLLLVSRRALWGVQNNLAIFWCRRCSCYLWALSIPLISAQWTVPDEMLDWTTVKTGTRPPWPSITAAGIWSTTSPGGPMWLCTKSLFDLLDFRHPFTSPHGRSTRLLNSLLCPNIRWIFGHCSLKSLKSESCLSSLFKCTGILLIHKQLLCIIRKCGYETRNCQSIPSLNISCGVGLPRNSTDVLDQLWNWLIPATFTTLQLGLVCCSLTFRFKSLCKSVHQHLEIQSVLRAHVSQDSPRCAL